MIAPWHADDCKLPGGEESITIAGADLACYGEDSYYAESLVAVKIGDRALGVRLHPTNRQTATTITNRILGLR